MAGFLPAMEFMDVAPAINAFRMGSQDGVQAGQRNLLREVGQVASTQGFDAASKTALAGGDVSTGLKISELSLDRKLKLVEVGGNGALMANTPEKWDVYTNAMAGIFGEDAVSKFRPYSARDSMILLSKNAMNQLLQQKATEDFNRAVGGGGPAAPAPVAPSPVGPSGGLPPSPVAEVPGLVAPARPKVNSTALLVGDDEGVRDGLYPAPKVVGPVAAPTDVSAQARPPVVPAQDAYDQRTLALIKGANNPNLPKAQQEIVGKLLEHSLRVSDPTGNMKEYAAAVKQGYKGGIEDWIGEGDKRKQSQVTVNAFANPLLKGVSDQFLEDRAKARASTDDIRAIHAAREEVDRGIFSGSAANVRLGIAKVGTLLGMPNDKVANTEAFTAAVGARVLALVKGLGAGAGISNADREFASKMAGGEIKLDESSIRKILDIGERAGRSHISTYNKQAKRYQDALPDDAKAQGALLGVDEPGQYTKPSAPAAPTLQDVQREIQRRQGGR